MNDHHTSLPPMSTGNSNLRSIVKTVVIVYCTLVGAWLFWVLWDTWNEPPIETPKGLENPMPNYPDTIPPEWLEPGQGK